MGRTSSCELIVTRHTGRVKWFNVKNGYGFITPVDNGENSHLNSDIFVHHSSIVVGKNQYKYLTEGEYVDFELQSTENSEHEYHAVNVTGVARGLLLCETRFEHLEENRRAPRPRDEPRTPRVPRDEPKTPRAPRDEPEDGFEFPKQRRLTRQSTR